MRVIRYVFRSHNNWPLVFVRSRATVKVNYYTNKFGQVNHLMYIGDLELFKIRAFYVTIKSKRLPVNLMQ